MITLMFIIIIIVYIVIIVICIVGCVKVTLTKESEQSVTSYSWLITGYILLIAFSIAALIVVCYFAYSNYQYNVTLNNTLVTEYLISTITLDKLSQYSNQKSTLENSQIAVANIKASCINNNKCRSVVPVQMVTGRIY